MSKNKQIQISSIISQAEVLAKQHEIFTDKHVTKANEELYVLLSEIMSVCMQVEASAISDNIINQMRKTLSNVYEIKTQKNSRASSIVVRYVIRTNRKTAHIYGRVIETAILNSIKPVNLPEFIRSKGGIDAIRKAVVNTETKKQAEAVNAVYRNAMEHELYKKQTLGTVQLNSSVNTRIAEASDVTFTYLMCINDPKTGLQVVSTLYPSSTIEQQAIELTQITLLAAAKSGTPDFYQFCKDNGLNMDLVHRWMSTNGLVNASEANKLAKQVHVAAKSQLQPASVVSAPIQQVA